MRTKTGKILGRMFSLLAIISFLIVGCTKTQPKVSTPTVKEPKAAQAVAPAPKTPPSPPQEQAVAHPPAKELPAQGPTTLPQMEHPAAETGQDPIASGAVLLNPSILQDAKTIQSRLAELGFYEGAIDGLWGKGSRTALKAFKGKNSLKNPDTWDKETQIVLFAKASQAGQPAAETSQDPIASGAVLLNPSILQDAKTIQSRLAELGFYKEAIDGIWGKGSQTALKAFKEKNSLKNPDTWDKETQKLLFKEISK